MHGEIMEMIIKLITTNSQGNHGNARGNYGNDICAQEFHQIMEMHEK